MNLQHVRAMARKEWWHLLRDPRSLSLMFLMPAMLLFLFGYAIRLDIVEAPIGVLQESSDAASRDLVARFDASHAFAVAARYHDRRALTDAVQRGDIWAGLVVPLDFAERLQAHDARVQLILDGVDANSARLVNNYALALVNDYARSLGAEPPIEIRDRIWFNESRESRLAVIPGVIAVVMAVIGALMTALTAAREMELGNIVMLRTTPLTRGEFLAGKLIPYFVIGTADFLVAAAAALWLFEVPLRGPFLALLAVSALFLVVVMLQGMLISIAAGQQVLASQMALISSFLPAFLLSGFIFAIENMPVALQWLTRILPPRAYVTLSKAIFLKGVSPLLLWSEVAVLGAICLVLARVVLVRARKLGLQS